MKTRILLFQLLFFIGFSLIAQEDMAGYKLKISEAYELYKSKKYKESADTYAEGFAKINRKAYPNDRYNAACSYALSGNKDSAFYHLNRLAVSVVKYSNLSHLLSDADLNSLHEDDRWDELVENVKENKAEKEKNYNIPLVRILDTVYQTDQGKRQQLNDMADKYGWDSPEMKAFWKEINREDSINELKVTKILDEHGWLGEDVIGRTGNSALFLVIQHAPIETQQKYLPMMRQAVKDGKARGSSLALLEDRVNLRTGKKQIYGSQIGTDKDGKQYVMALEDPMNVDKRRAEVGLGTLNSYTSNWDFTFNAEEYLKELPKYEKLLEESMGNK